MVAARVWSMDSPSRETELIQVRAQFRPRLRREIQNHEANRICNPTVVHPSGSIHDYIGSMLPRGSFSITATLSKLPDRMAGSMTKNKLDTPVASPVQGRRQFGSRAALFAGFGTLLILMATVSIDSLYTLEAFETHNTQIRQEFVYREHTLEQVRTGVYESGDIMSDDAVIEADQQSQKRLRTEFQSIRDQTTASLKACIESLPTDKRESFQHLAEELERYWLKVDAIFALHATEKRGLGHSALRSDVLSQYAEVLAITKEVRAVNDNELKETDQRIVETFVQFRRRLLVFAMIGFSFGLILATTTIVYAGRLEKSLQEKYRESLQAQRELKELSKRLVDAEERERRAISRELHDEVGQSLSALLIDVENLTEMCSEDSAFRQGLHRIKTLAENCVNEVRNMALLLRPSMLDDLGLIAALDWQAREVSKRTGMIVDTVDENVSETLPEKYKTCVYRIVQEALNNCSKHAYARKIRVVVRQEPNCLRVSIEDDGKGFDASRVRGLGLVGMNERVSQLGGVLKVESDPARGTHLRVDLPLPNASPMQGD
jgi:signal transduction histidine kinase